MDSATSYNVEVNKSPDFASTGALGSASTVNVHWVPPFQLPQSQPVYWRVRGNTPGGATDWAVDTYTRGVQAAPTLTAPVDTAQLQQPNQPVRFAWNPVEGAVSYSLEVSEDKNFIDPARITTYSTGSTSITPNVLQPANTYYWRVTANLGGGINTPTSDVRSYQVTPPNLPLEPTYPVDDTTTTIQEVVLDWAPVDGAAKYNLQISTDPNFISGTTTVNSILGTRYSPPTTLDNDQYYWRITPVNASGVATDWSAVPTWHFRRNWPDQPSLEYPANNATVGDPLYFQWSGSRLASDYTLQFSTDSTFPGAGTTSCQTVHTTFTPNKSCWPAAGRKYYWRVLATDAPRIVASEFLNAQVRSFTYLPDLVSLEAPIEGDSMTIPTLRWKPYSGAKQYLVSVSNSSGNVAASATTTSTSYTPTAKLAAGTYHWQVQAITGDGRTTNAVLESSQPTFIVSDPPAGTADTPEPTLPAASTPRNPTLTWTPVANATSYKLIYRAVGDIGWTTPATSYAYPAGEIAGNGLSKGEYEWYVVAYNSGLKLSESSVHGFFTISAPDTVGGYRAAIIGTDLFTPSGSWCDATLPATCKDLRQTPVLHWDADPNAAWYHLVISRDDQLTNRVLELDIYNTTWMNTAALPDSTAGSAYYWEVVPCTLAGCGGLSQAAHAFNKLSNPVVLKDVTATANDVTLSWQDYLASLSVAQTDQTALSTPARTEAESYRVQTSTSPQFTSFLDNIVVDQTTFTSFTTTYPEGPIYWRVQALDGSANALAWSANGQFVKSSPAPTQVSPLATDGDVDGSVTFSWNPQRYAATYNLEVYKNDDTIPSPANRVINATGLKQVNFTPTTPLPAATSNYRWRIQRVDGAGRVGAWSALTPFHVSGSPASALAPAADAVVEPRGAVFAWAPPATGRPAKYRFTATSGTTVVTADTVARAYAPTVKLADGDWSWTVSTLDTAGQVVATSERRSFTVVGKPTTNVRITGSGKVGTALAADPVVWTPSTDVTTTYQWYAGTSAISGATSPQYSVRAADAGKAITVRVTGVKLGYDPGTATSNAITALTGDSPIVTASPYISGTRAVGKTLTAVPGSWTGANTTFTYRWFQSGAAISGATAQTYVVRTADAAKTLSVEVTARQTGLAPGVAMTPAVTVARMATTAGLSLASSRIRKSVAPRVSVTVTAPSGVTATGVIRVYNGTRMVKQYTLTTSNRGRVTLTLPRTTVGRHYIKAKYLGNPVLSPSAYARRTLTVVR